MKRKKLEPSSGGTAEVIKEKIFGVLLAEGGRLSALLGPAAVFVTALLVGSVRAPLGTYPLSYAALASVCGWEYVAAAFAGSVLSATALDVGAVVQISILSSMLLVRLAVCFLKGDMRDRATALRRIFRERGYVRVILASLGSAAFGCFTIWRSESIYYGLFSALLGIGETALASAALVFFANRRAEPRKRLCGFLVLLLGLMAAVEGIGLPFSLSAVLTFLLAVYFSYAGGAAIGTAVGFAGGMAVGIPYAPALGSVGVVCALIWSHSRIGAVAVAALTASALSLFGGGLDAVTDIIPELALAAAVACPFVSLGPIPKGLPSFLCFEGRAKADVPSQKRGTEGERLRRVGKALESLSAMLYEIGSKMRLPTEEEAHRICTSARAKFCSGCPGRNECEGREKSTVDSMFANLDYLIGEWGIITENFVPDSVARRCFNMAPIIESINRKVRKNAALTGAGKRNELFASDYKAVAALFSEMNEDEWESPDKEAGKRLSAALYERGFSFEGADVYGKRQRRVYMRGVDMGAVRAGEEDIRRSAEEVLSAKLSSPEFSLDGGRVNASMESVPRISLRCGRHSVKSMRDSTTGDSVSTFENREGYHYTLVSDGMGTGREAALTSGLCAAFLEKLLSAGCPMRSALELLNCFVRGGEGECFATVDMMEADLYTGRARFIKSGAAPSFVIRNGRLYRIHSKTVPIGIMRALDAESVSFDLLEGDTVVMMSDGVCGSYEDCPWLFELLSNGLLKDEPPAAAAVRIARTAAEMTGRDDDITVCVLRVEAA